MSHEVVTSDRRLVYTMPAWPSDVLRSREFSHFFASFRGVPFSVQTRDGWQWFSCPWRDAVFTASFSTRDKLDAVLHASSEDALGRIFLDGDLDVQGDIFALLSVAEFVLRHSSGFSRGLVQTLSRASLGWFRTLTSGFTQSPPIQRSSEGCPFDLSQLFFESWLGPSLGNSCARFPSPLRDPSRTPPVCSSRNSDDALEAAQRHSLERVCAALELAPGDRLLDMSCGWGNTLLHAAAHHGVHAHGISASEQQAAIAAERIARHNLSRHCLAQPRSPASPFGPAAAFHKIVDIGLFDQVLSPHLHDYLATAFNQLAPGGLLLLHRTTRCPRLPRTAAGPHPPDTPRPAELASLAEELQLAESLGFHLLGLEDLGDDLRHTLRLWIEQLQWMAQSHTSTHYRNYRTWLFHVLDTATNLEAGSVQFHQILLRRPAQPASEVVSYAAHSRNRWSH